VVGRALDRIAGRLPDITDDDEAEPICPAGSLDERRADALTALCSASIADDHDPDRPTVVVHAPIDALACDVSGCHTDNGAILHPETMRRIGCDCRLEILLEDAAGTPVGIGRAARNVPPHLMRALRYRDQTCTFPGCGARWFLKAHHIRRWGHGGPTNLDNLLLCCHVHHKLVHEHGWRVELGSRGTARWFPPDGAEYDPGRGPPRGLHKRSREALTEHVAD
jgi:hypothetical protein